MQTGPNSSRLPMETMNVRSNSLRLIVLTALVLFTGLAVAPVRAQVVSVLDEHNSRVFINLAPVAPKPVPPADASGTKTAKPATGTTQNPGNAQTPGGNSASSPGGTTSTNGAQQITSDRLEELIQTTATRHNVDPALVRAVMETESGGNPTAVSRKGALGLMQLMPGTAMQLGVKNVFSPQDNLEAGVTYLRSMLEHYNGDLDRALAAYNAGMGAVDRAGGVPRYRETQDYVRKVTNNYLSGDSGKVGTSGSSKTPMTGGATNARLASAPPVTHKMYKTVDEQGRVVWSND